MSSVCRTEETWLFFLFAIFKHFVVCFLISKFVLKSCVRKTFAGFTQPQSSYSYLICASNCFEITT